MFQNGLEEVVRSRQDDVKEKNAEWSQYGGGRQAC